MNFAVLGPLEVRSRDGVCTPRGPMVRKVLALLVLQAGQVVDVDSLVEELWADEPPATAIGAVRTHLYHLRRILDAESPAADLLVTRPSGYLLRVPEDRVDLQLFRRSAERGRALFRSGRLEDAADSLDHALGLWRGRCLADVAHGPLLAAHVRRLTELRSSVLELRIEADLQLGRHRELIPELRDLAAGDPLNEWFHARLMTALARSGRRSEALRVFQNLRRTLNAELGVEPSGEVQRRLAEILAGHEDNALPISA